MAGVMLMRGVPERIRSDNGPEMTAKVVRDWLTQVGAGTLFIEPGSPWENGYYESFNGNLREELLNGEIFYSLKEAKIVIEQWRGGVLQTRGWEGRHEKTKISRRAGSLKRYDQKHVSELMTFCAAISKRFNSEP